MGIADDYENLEHIRSAVARDGLRCGVTISDFEITRGLADLVDAGLARAYRLSGAEVGEFQGMPTLQEAEDFYTHFWATQTGRELMTVDREWWPFDDLGELRSDWVPPED